ncbi:hypothetical protein BHM03_00041017 [Ensete ventricosum]|nr:hypothetical protein BHM03_00041017 [Ensete ventricosum]
MSSRCTVAATAPTGSLASYVLFLHPPLCDVCKVSHLPRPIPSLLHRLRSAKVPAREETLQGKRRFLLCKDGDVVIHNPVLSRRGMGKANLEQARLTWHGNGRPNMRVGDALQQQQKSDARHHLVQCSLIQILWVIRQQGKDRTR